MSVILAGTVRFALPTLPEAKQRMLEMMRLTRAEDGCVAYTYAEDLAEPGLIHVYELWRDQGALDAHHHAPHFIKWRDDRETLGMSDRNLVLHDVSASRPR